MEVSPCPNCRSKTLYRTIKPVSAGGGHAPNFLPGLGRTFSAEKFHIIVCADCGLTRFFARPEALGKLSASTKWEHV